MSLTSQLQWDLHPSGMGERAVMEFPNGYSASVVGGGPFYTKGGTFEVAVMHGDNIDYTTPITNDVLGYLSADELEKALRDIEALPAKEGNA